MKRVERKYTKFLLSFDRKTVGKDRNTHWSQSKAGRTRRLHEMSRAKHQGNNEASLVNLSRIGKAIF